MKSPEAPPVGILGGTFDPIHIGHLIVAEEIRIRYNLQKVLFIPSAYPPHKLGREIAPAQLRWEMVRLAVQDNPYFQASNIEVERKAVSYTVDTLTRLRELWGEKVKLYLIIGTDEAINFPNWKEPERIFDLCTVVVVNRPGLDQGAISPVWREKMEFARVPQIEVSATGIRRRLREGKTIRYLVPKPVEEFVYAKRLYLGK